MPPVFAVAIAFLTRALLVALFLPFSALDKLLNFSSACDQADTIGVPRGLGRGMILIGLAIEIVMSLGVLTGVADRMAALILAGYCVATALLYKRFWSAPDFRLKGPSHTPRVFGREVFWDFLKNLAVAGGFLLITFGTTARSVDAFLAAPFSSTHPYAITQVGD